MKKYICSDDWSGSGGSGGSGDGWSSGGIGDKYYLNIKHHKY